MGEVTRASSNIRAQYFKSGGEKLWNSEVRPLYITQPRAIEERRTARRLNGVSWQNESDLSSKCWN